MTEQTLTALEQLARRERDLTRWLYANFRSKLSFDEARDAVQDAFEHATALHETLDTLAPKQVERWLRQAARSKAIDRIRARDGEERYGSRRSSVNFDDVHARLVDDGKRSGGAATLDAGDQTLEEVLRGFEQVEEVTLVRGALQRLSGSEREVLQLRWTENLAPDACADVLGISKTKYERLYTRALEKLRSVFAATRITPACDEARVWLDAVHHLSPEAVAFCTDHIDVCLHCRAYERRKRGLIALLPLPGVGVIDRLAARLAQLSSHIGGGTSAAESATAAAVAGGGTAAAGGGAGLLGGLAGGKAIVTACGVAAATLCGGFALERGAVDRTPDRPAAKVARSTERPTRSVAAPPVLSPSQPSGASRPSSRAAKPTRPSTATRHRDTARSEVASLTLEDFQRPQGARPTPTAQVAKAAAAPSTPARTERAVGTSNSSFSKEFTP